MGHRPEEADALQKAKEQRRVAQRRQRAANIGHQKDEEDDGVDFHERLTELNEELEQLNSVAKGLEDQIGKNISELLK